MYLALLQNRNWSSWRQKLMASGHWQFLQRGSS